MRKWGLCRMEKACLKPRQRKGGRYKVKVRCKPRSKSIPAVESQKGSRILGKWTFKGGAKSGWKQVSCRSFSTLESQATSYQRQQKSRGLFLGKIDKQNTWLLSHIENKRLWWKGTPRTMTPPASFPYLVPKTLEIRLMPSKQKRTLWGNRSVQEKLLLRSGLGPNGTARSLQQESLEGPLVTKSLPTHIELSTGFLGSNSKIWRLQIFWYLRKASHMTVKGRISKNRIGGPKQ